MRVLVRAFTMTRLLKEGGSRARRAKCIVSKPSLWNTRSDSLPTSIAQTPLNLLIEPISALHSPHLHLMTVHVHLC